MTTTVLELILHQKHLTRSAMTAANRIYFNESSTVDLTEHMEA